MTMIFREWDVQFFFLNFYGIATGSCVIFAIMACLRRQWDRVQLLVITIPFLAMSFLDGYYAWACVEVFTQLLTLSD